MFKEANVENSGLGTLRVGDPISCFGGASSLQIRVRERERRERRREVERGRERRQTHRCSLFFTKI